MYVESANSTQVIKKFNYCQLLYLGLRRTKRALTYTFNKFLLNSTFNNCIHENEELLFFSLIQIKIVIDGSQHAQAFHFFFS